VKAHVFFYRENLYRKTVCFTASGSLLQESFTHPDCFLEASALVSEKKGPKRSPKFPIENFVPKSASLESAYKSFKKSEKHESFEKLKKLI